jgi:hypothetical protein
MSAQPDIRVFPPQEYEEVTIDLRGPQPWTPMLHPQETQAFFSIVLHRLMLRGYDTSRCTPMKIDDFKEAMNTGIVKVQIPLKSP